MANSLLPGSGQNFAQMLSSEDPLAGSLLPGSDRMLPQISSTEDRLARLLLSGTGWIDVQKQGFQDCGGNLSYIQLSLYLILSSLPLVQALRPRLEILRYNTMLRTNWPEQTCKKVLQPYLQCLALAMFGQAPAASSCGAVSIFSPSLKEVGVIPFGALPDPEWNNRDEAYILHH